MEENMTHPSIRRRGLAVAATGALIAASFVAAGSTAVATPSAAPAASVTAAEEPSTPVR
jgi:hypothetical protein